MEGGVYPGAECVMKSLIAPSAMMQPVFGVSFVASSRNAHTHAITGV